MLVETRKRVSTPSLLSLTILLLSLFLSLPTYSVKALNVVEDLRYSSDVERFRLVLEFEREPDYLFYYLESPSRLVIDVLSTSYPLEQRSLDFSDPSISSLEVESQGSHFRVVLHLTEVIANFQDFTLREPHRLVIDIFRDLEYERDYQVLVTPGLYYRQIHRRGVLMPLLINILEADISSRHTLQLLPVLSQGQILGGEEVSSISQRYHAIAAINGTFFDGNYRPLGLLVIDGLMVSEPILGRTAFGLREDGEMLMDRVHTQIEIQTPSGPLVVDGVNRTPQDGEVILYNHLYGLRIPQLEARGFLIRDERIIKEVAPGEILPTDAFILLGLDPGDERLNQLEIGDAVEIQLTHQPSAWNEGLLHAIGGGPRLVTAGEKTITAVEEHFRADVVVGRAPRTALGIKENGSLLFVTVSGRTEFSRGMTLHELADLMLELGAVEAMNLDGGGSTTMVLRQRIFNQPSAGEERRVSNALLLLPY